ncbi:MAG: hypothetical protein MJA82_15655 [Clostridia bacterium]|nr:hypothetical protein [Clostridia bacterium]
MGNNNDLTKSEINNIVSNYLTKNTIQLKMADGSKSDSVTCAASVFYSCSDSKVAAFILPEGYRRYQFSDEKETTNGNANVFWLNNDPYNASIKLEVNANAPNGQSRAAVSNVTGIKE